MSLAKVLEAGAGELNGTKLSLATSFMWADPIFSLTLGLSYLHCPLQPKKGLQLLYLYLLHSPTFIAHQKQLHFASLIQVPCSQIRPYTVVRPSLQPISSKQKSEF